MSLRKDLEKKKFLVIDDQAEMRLVVKQIITELGGSQIDQATTGEEALEAMLRTKYDYIMCDYNLVVGRNGQQVLEEIKYRRKLSSNTVYIMVTGENSYEMVMAALEFSPDVYLSKPVTPQELMNRIKKANEKKNVLRKIGSAYDRQDWAGVLKESMEVIKAKTPYTLDAYRYMLDASFFQKQYDRVIKACSSILSAREVPWVRLYLGKAHFYLNQYEDARDNFKQIYDENEAYVTAGDWLARTQQILGDSREAQMTLEKTAQHSPRGIQRQQLLARVAQANGDVVTASKAFKASSQLGQHSVHRDSDDYLNYTDCVIGVMEKEGGLANSRAYQDALYAIDQMLDDFKSMPAEQIKAYLQRRKICASNGRDNEAKNAVGQALKILEVQRPRMRDDELVDVAFHMDKHGQDEMAKQLACDLYWKVQDNPELASKLDTFYDGGAMSPEDRQKLEADLDHTVKTFNKEGLQLFKEESYDRAIKSFARAYDALKEGKERLGREMNLSICLNAAHSLINYMHQQTGVSSDHLAQLEEYLGHCKDLKRTDDRHGRYIELYQQYQKMV